MRIIEAVPGADERVVVISSPDDPSQDRISAEVRRFPVPFCCSLGAGEAPGVDIVQHTLMPRPHAEALV